MSDVVVTLELGDASDELKLAEAINAFAEWQTTDEPATECEHDIPPIMVKTQFSRDGVRKSLIFQERRFAAAFLSFWRTERRKGH